MKSSINLLRVCQRGAILRECIPPDTTHSTLLICTRYLLTIMIEPCVYKQSIQNMYKQLRACIWNGCHTVLISQHCNFMLINVMCFRILIIPMSAMHIKLACWPCIPLIWKTPWGWYPRVETSRKLLLVINCILLSGIVGWHAHYHWWPPQHHSFSFLQSEIRTWRASPLVWWKR
jgi:hypothetical protein